MLFLNNFLLYLAKYYLLYHLNKLQQIFGGKLTTPAEIADATIWRSSWGRVI